MDYIESLLKLIKSKKDLSGDNAISLSVGEIADAWNRDVVREDIRLAGMLASGELVPRGGSKFIDRYFLKDVISAIKKIQDEKLILFEYTVENCSTFYPYQTAKESNKPPSISDIGNFYSPDDRIYLEVIGDIDKKLVALNPEPLIADNKKQKLAFNPQTGVIIFGDIIHKFQRGMRGEKDRILLFKKLWDEKRYIKNGVNKIVGKPLPPEFLAVQLNITENATTFNRNTKAKNRFFGIIKGINRILKDKGFPAKIERQNGIQFVITEK